MGKDIDRGGTEEAALRTVTPRGEDVGRMRWAPGGASGQRAGSRGRPDRRDRWREGGREGGRGERHNAREHPGGATPSPSFPPSLRTTLLPDSMESPPPSHPPQACTAPDRLNFEFKRLKSGRFTGGLTFPRCLGT